MDELELIRALRDEEPDPAARAHARRALRERMDGPVAGRSRPRPRSRWLIAPLGLAGIAAVVIAVATGVDDATIAPAPATAALERAARAAEQRPEPLLGPADYFYVRDRSAYLTTFADGPGWSVLVPSERETWTNRKGGTRFSDRAGGRATFPGPRDRRRWSQAGSPDLSQGSQLPAGAGDRVSGHDFGAGGSMLTYKQLRALPSGGRAMYRRLLELANGAGPSPDEEAFVIIGDLLRSVPVPARARAGLYRAAAYIKGVRYVGAVRDELGRRGVAVELTSRDTRHRLVFDPTTSQVLAEQDVLTKRVPYIDAGPGFVTGYRLVLKQGIVKSDRARP
ncbi:MAG: hypothetical protein QOG15_2416 [Solirubrobacteraceae bacterium]|jgi:hypothetical protein|nr:hypothetical protein [Solirubrobacteraceae bacterium]